MCLLWVNLNFYLTSICSVILSLCSGHVGDWCQRNANVYWWFLTNLMWILKSTLVDFCIGSKVFHKCITLEHSTVFFPCIEMYNRWYFTTFLCALVDTILYCNICCVAYSLATGLIHWLRLWCKEQGVTLI